MHLMGMTLHSACRLGCGRDRGADADRGDGLAVLSASKLLPGCCLGNTSGLGLATKISRPVLYSYFLHVDCSVAS